MNRAVIEKQKKLDKIDMIKEYKKFVNECYDENYYTVCYPTGYNYEKVKHIKMEFIDAMLSLTEKDYIKKVLVVGCATGTFIKALKERGFYAVGLDMSEWAIKHAITQGDGMVLGDVKAMPFEDNSFDIILAPSMLEQIPEEFMDETIKSLTRVTNRYVIILTAFGDRYKTQDHIIKESKEWWWEKFEPILTVINKENPYHYPKTLPSERWDIILAEKI